MRQCGVQRAMRRFSSAASTSLLHREAIRLLLSATRLQQSFCDFAQQPGAAALRTEDVVHVADSTVCDGRGLFASADLQAGRFLSFYPVHATGVVDERGLHRWTHSSSVAHFETSAADDEQHHFTQSLTHDDVLRLAESSFSAADLPLFIDVNPDQSLQPGWLGHLINDVDVCRSGDDEEVHRYYGSCYERANCFNVPLGPAPLMAYVTTTHVPKGEELLTAYFPAFWLQPHEVPDLEDAPAAVAALGGRLEQRFNDCERATVHSFRREASLLASWMTRLQRAEDASPEELLDNLDNLFELRWRGELPGVDGALVKCFTPHES